jgi:hypothetical protein
VRLPEFILENVEPILAQWEKFARGIWPGDAEADPAELRDDAEAILLATVADMRSDQTAAEQFGKSEGRGGDGDHSRGLDSASVRHGRGRVDSGFALMQVIAEYRALRASVVRLWRESKPNPGAEDLDDLTRFHESMDQSLERAVGTFSQHVDQSRMLFLSVLGHDLRNPLNAVVMCGALMEMEHSDNPDLAEFARQISSSAGVMEHLIRDLLEFAAHGLGGPMPLARRHTDLRALCREVTGEIQSAHPNCKLDCEAHGDLTGDWDEARLRQAISNLLGNAIHHGPPDCTVRLRARGEDGEVIISVHNGGEPIPPALLPVIFDPLRRMSVRGPTGERFRRQRAGSIGLGLYITHQVVTSHGGTINVTSSEEAGTEFTVRLPR